MLRLLELFFFVASTGIWFAVKFQENRTAHRIAGFISLVSFLLLVPTLLDMTQRIVPPYLGGAPSSDPLSSSDADEIFWQAIKNTDVVTLFEEFVRRFPASSHATEARARIRALQEGRPVPSTATPQPESRPPPPSAETFPHQRWGPTRPFG
jgi:hypothetical protein